MPDRNGSGYVSPTEGKAVHKLTLKEEREAWYKEHPLPPKSPDHLDEDALYIADNRRPANRWAEFTEAQEQSDLFRWADLAKGKYPELTLMFHIPNGGSRNVAEAANLKKQGVKAGVPDLFLPVARGQYHGLFIEMKASKGRLMENQKTWLRRLNNQGYLALVAWGYDEAVRIIEGYLNDH